MCGPDTWIVIAGLLGALVVCIVGLIVVAWFTDPEPW